MANNPDAAALQVSVIVPFYNSASYLEPCIEALLAQSYPPSSYEVLMVDNNSTDKSADTVLNYSRVRMLKEGKQGAYAARNTAVKTSSGEILAFTDSDCVTSPDWLKELVTPFSDPVVGLVQGRRTFGDDGSALSMLAAYETEIHAHIFSGQNHGPLFGYTNNMAVRREIFDRCGPFIETARGADSVFVDRVVRTFSHKILRYARGATIRHLELNSVRYWLRKKAIYGRTFQRHRNERTTHRDLTPSERRAIFIRTLERGGYSKAQAAQLLAMLTAGRLSFLYGRLTSRRTVAGN